LGDLDAEVLKQAAVKLGSENTFFPKAAELRKASFDLLEGDDLPLPMEGWRQLEKTWQCGYVEFHALTEKTIQAMGGLRKLGQTQDKQLPFVRAQFLSTFETYRNREITDRRQLPSVKEYKQLQAGRIGDAFKKLADKKRGLGDGNG
jgi:hypothetical protein